MKAPFRMQVTFTANCRLCGKVAEDIDRELFLNRTFTLAIGYPLPIPSLPMEWQVLNGDPICPDHKLTALVKGKRVKLDG